MKKRVLSMLMALVLCLTLLPTAALADELGPVDGTSTVETAGADAEAEAKAKAGAEAVAAVQAMINALPDALTEENAGDVSAMLGEIDAAMAALEDEERAALDLTQYQAAIAALAALAAAQGEIALYADEGTQPTEGSGLKGNPYLIGTLEELKWFRTQVNSGNNDICAKLTADITLSEWEPIGTQGSPYKGTFDGSGCTISGASVPDSTTQDWGLFGYIGSGGTVKWIVASIEGLSINCAQSGVIAAHNAGIIECCSVDIYGLAGSLSISEDFGLIAYENSGTIENCRGEARASSGASNLNASDGAKAAGIAFDNSKGTIQSCYFSGRFRYTISGDSTTGYTATSDDYAIASNRGTITNCYYLGDSRVGIYLDDTVADASDGIVGVPVSNWQQPNTALNSGAVTWKLNGSDNNKTDPWRQDFISSTRQGTPTLNRAHGRVTKNDDGSYKLETPHTHWTNGELKEFTAVNSASDCGSSGYYYLNADNITLSKQWEISGDAILCLNGKTLTTAGENNIAVKNGTLTLMDDNGAAGQITGTGGSCIAVSGGMFKLENSKISGNTTGVMLDGGAFTMQGGEISGNTVGVHVKSGKLTLGGKAQITGNDKNILLAQGSKISFDSLDPSAKFGISVENQKDLSDPVAVTDATGGQYFAQLVADGFKNDGSGFELYLSDDGDTVMLGRQSVHTHCICGNSSKNVNGHTHDAGITFLPWTETNKLPASGNYYLTRNVTLTGNAGLGNANVCLNGYTVTLSDVGRINPSGTTQLTDCSVDGKLESYPGKANGGVAISGGSKFYLYGGTLNGVKVEIGQTGGGTFNMYGGKITGNTKGTVVGQSKTSGSKSAITINMYGGEISGNNISENQGGGVFVGSGNQFNMYGGTIQNNSAVDGGGVYIAPAGNAYSAGEMTICGDAVIQGNKAGSVLNNVSLPSGKTITISGKLGKNANIGVTTRANLSQGNVNIATATDAGWVVAKNFTSDNPAYHVGLVNDGKTVQLQVHSHQWKYSVSPDGTTITAKCTAGNCDLESGNGGSVKIVAPSGSLIYDGNEHTATVNKSQDWQGEAVDTSTIVYTKEGDDTFIGKPKDAGTYTASITVGEGENAATASVKYTIAQAELTIDSVTVASKTYNGSADAEITNVTFTGLKNSEALTKDTDYEVSGTFNSANVNEANKVTGTVTLKDTSKVKNYKLPITTYDVSATIAQAATPAAPTGLTGVKDQLLSTVSLAAHPGWSWADGAVSMSTAGPQNFNANYHDSNGNYADGTNVPVSVNVVNKTDTGVTITGLPQTVTYGDAFTLEAAQTGDTGTSGKWSWDFDGDYFQEKSTGGHQETLTLQAIKAGTPSKGITATYESGTHKGSATVNAVVEKKEVTVSGIAAENKEYDGGTTATVNASGATITGKVDGDKLTITATGTFADADAGENKTVTLTLGTLGGADSANYTLATAGNQTETKANITAKDVSISAVTVSDKDYSGNANATVASVTITGVSGALSMGTDFDVTSATFPDADADTANVDVTINVALKDTAANNYNLTNGMGYVVTSAAKINKAAYGGAAPTKTVNILKNYAGVQTGRLTAADFFTTAPAEAKITHAVPNSNPSSMMSLAGEDSSGNFTYASKKNITAASDESWTITISSKNYTDITATLTFSPVDRTDAGVTISSVPASKTYGESFTLTASVTDAGTGTVSWTWTSNDPSVLQVTGTGASATVKALKAGSATISAKYESDTTMGEQTTAPITVGKRVITVTADNKSMTVNGTLPTFTVTYGNLPSGVQAADIFGTMASASTTTDGKTTGSFDITVTTPVLKAEAGANYEVGAVTKGTLTVNPRSSSGGGGGSSVSTYSVTVGKTDNGSVSVSPKSASKGDTVTITVTPDKGYVLETLTVLDKNDKEIKLTEKNGKYTFTMPAGKVEVKATFMEDNSMLNFFMDVKAGDYFYDAVLWAAEKGITSGTDATHFSPNAACTRAQIVTFLWRAAGSPEPKGTGSFADVPADSYYTKAVAWAVENGITGGTGDGKFSPDATCTRAQAVTFLYRASGASAVSGNAAFSDVATNAYYAAAVKWAEKNGVTGGIGGGLFGSGNDCTRAQIVTFLYRTYQGK